MCTEDSFGSVPVEGGVQAEEIKRLTNELDTARQVVLEKSTKLSELAAQYRRVERDLQEGIDDLDDREFADALVDFLNDRTPWEFKATRTFRVEIAVYVTVEAADEDEAREWAEEAISVDSTHDAELESTDVRDCEVVSD